MLRYFTSLLVVLATVLGSAQNKPIDTKPQDTVIHNQYYGLRVGIDLSRPITSFLDDNYTGLEIVADYRLTKKIYIAVELGNEDKTKQEDLYNFTTTGNYLKVGVEKNTYANWYGEHNSIFMGGRLAHSRFKNTLNNYQIFDANRYWNPDDFANGSNTPEVFENLNATWLEGVFGTKVELFTNLYLGASIRLAFLLDEKEDKRFPNLYIPGFNKVTDGSKFGVGYNYSISYFLPLYKKKDKPKKRAAKTKEVVE